MNKKKGAANTKVKIQHGGGGRVEVPTSLLNARREPGTRMSVLLANPDYLLEGFAEKRAQYIGAIDDLPTSADMSNRNYLLAKLDDRRNSGKLPWRLGIENNVTITLSAYNVKIIKDDRAGNILHRIPIHEIAAVSYVNDDDQHLVFLKAGDARKPQCPCHVLLCPKRADAEEICTILQQAFQLVFTEATMEHLNSSISAGERESMFLSSAPAPQSHATRVPQMAGATHPQKQQQARASALADPGDSSDSDDITPIPSMYSHSLEHASESPSAEELVQRYMQRLHKLLGFSELQEFATLLKSYRDNTPVLEFLTKLKVLYGPQRSFLIPDMQSFIPEEDREVFEKFLYDNGLVKKSKTPHSPPTSILPPPSMAPPPLPSMAPPPQPIAATAPPQGQSPKQKRRKGRALHNSEVDQILHHIEADMNSVIESTDF